MLAKESRRCEEVPAAGAFKIQIDSTGTRVIDRTKAVIIAKPTEMASGTNRLPAAPSIMKDGRNTARIQRMDSRMGMMVSAVPSKTACGTDSALLSWL